jgi:GNAT superfamily N-acetyltransferase
MSATSSVDDTHDAEAVASVTDPLRPLWHSDAEPVKAIADSCWGDAAPTLKFYNRAAESGFSWVRVDCDGEVEGAACSILIPCGCLGFPANCYIVDISVLAVREESRRKGIGKSLMNAVLDMARSEDECCSVQLNVDVANEGARHLYESCGFQIVGDVLN